MVCLCGSPPCRLLDFILSSFRLLVSWRCQESGSLIKITSSDQMSDTIPPTLPGTGSVDADLEKDYELAQEDVGGPVAVDAVDVDMADEKGCLGVKLPEYERKDPVLKEMLSHCAECVAARTVALLSDQEKRGWSDEGGCGQSR